jgi:hypothetical protein
MKETKTQNGKYKKNAIKVIRKEKGTEKREECREGKRKTGDEKGERRRK